MRSANRRRTFSGPCPSISSSPAAFLLASQPFDVGSHVTTSNALSARNHVKCRYVPRLKRPRLRWLLRRVVPVQREPRSLRVDHNVADGFFEGLVGPHDVEGLLRECLLKRL